MNLFSIRDSRKNPYPTTDSILELEFLGRKHGRRGGGGRGKGFLGWILEGWGGTRFWILK